MVTNWLESDHSVSFEVEAACTEADATDGNTPGMETFTVTQHGDTGLQSALSWLIGLFYCFAGLLFLFSVNMIQRDLKLMKEEQVPQRS